MVVGVVVGISEIVVNVAIDVIAREVVVVGRGKNYVPSTITFHHGLYILHLTKSQFFDTGHFLSQMDT